MLDYINIHPLSLKILQSVAAAIITYAIAYILIQLLNKKIKDIHWKHRIRKTLYYTANILAIWFVLMIWLENMPSLTTIMSFTGAGLVLTLREEILSISAWLYITFQKPYSTGDRIEINNIKGDVIDIGILQTFMLEVGNWVKAEQTTGRIINFPNNYIFKHSLFNYTKSFEYIWEELPITITFESDWKKAHSIMLEQANIITQSTLKEAPQSIKNLTEKYAIVYKNFTPIVYTSIEDFGVRLTLRYLVSSRQRRNYNALISEKLLDLFNLEPSISFAYPTYRIYRK